MLGWFREPAVRASRSSRRMYSGVASDGVDDLERDVAAQPRVAGAVDLAHASGPEPPDDLVGAEAIASREGDGNLRRLVSGLEAERQPEGDAAVGIACASFLGVHPVDLKAKHGHEPLC